MHQTLRSALFWDIRQGIVVIPYRRFGPNYRSHHQWSWVSWLLKMGPVVYPETSLTNCQCSLPNIPEERRSHLYNGGNRISRIHQTLFLLTIYIKQVKFYGHKTGNKDPGLTTEESVLEFSYCQNISLTFKPCRHALPDHYAPNHRSNG